MLLGIAGSAAAQSSCAITLIKSGTGFTRTYTATSAASGSVNYVIYSTGGGAYTSGTSSTGKSLSVTYTDYGVYSVWASASTGTCIDTVEITDTITGPVNCGAGITLNKSQGGNNPQFFFFLSSAPTLPPGYTATVLYSYGDGTTDAVNITSLYNSHNYIRPQSNTKVKATVTYTHPVFPTCILSDSLYINVNTCSGITNNGIYRSSQWNGDYFEIYQYGSSGLGTNYTQVTRWYSLANGTGTPQQIGTGNTIFHTFPINGNYTIIATTSFAKTGVSNTLCVKTDTLSINVTNAFNNIRTWVKMDSFAVLPMIAPVLKTWLIKKDSLSGTLTAVDSVTKALDTSEYSQVFVDFHKVPLGNYRIKSHIINQAPGLAVHFIPTYSDTAVYWSLADSLILSTDTNVYKSLRLKKGIPVSGSGFIGGLISAGANKGTAEGDPVAGIDVLLRDISGKLISVATTGADGRYTFQNIGTGVYTVYPEELNFHTTASDPIVIGTTPAGITPRYNFKRNAADKEYVPGISLGVAGVTPELKAAVTPNPATDKLQINLGTAAGKVTATLSNATGQVVLQEIFTGISTTLSVSQLPAGIYTLQLQNGTEIHTEKVQIQH